jgi:Ser/Thr protein kinase RdoA (MazF antagonist)
VDNTLLSPELVQLIQTTYGVAVIDTPELLHERDEQRVFKLKLSEGGALVLRLCEQERPLAKVQADAGVLRFLNQRNFPAPSLRLTKSNTNFFEWQADAGAYAYDFIAGQNTRLDLPTLRTLAQMLATLHNLVHTEAEYPTLVNWLADLKPSQTNVAQYIGHAHWGPQAQEVANTLATLPDLTVLPQGLIHTDVHEGNLLRDESGKLWLMDWEDAGLGQMLLDIALVLGWYCVWPAKTEQPPDLYNFDEKWCRAFLSNYQRVRKLEPVETQYLGAAIKCVTGWFAARDIGWEVEEPGSSEGEAWSNWAIMRSVTPAWETKLTRWATETS